MANRFILNETSYHGAGAIQSIADEAKGRSFTKAFVCSDPDLIKFGVTKKVLDVLEGVADTKNKAVPIFAVPTTAGTAAEVTINYVITDAEKNRKMVCVDPHDIPVVAFIDPEMMASMPKGLTAATGMGFSNVGLGIVHSMAHPLGALYDTPHGIANAIILPTVMEYNAEATGEKYREIARAMGVKGVDDMTQEEYRKAAVDAVKQLSQDVGIPADLKDIVKREDIPFLAQSAYDDACRPGNPKETSVEDITKLYESLL